MKPYFSYNTNRKPDDDAFIAPPYTDDENLMSHRYDGLGITVDDDLDDFLLDDDFEQDEDVAFLEAESVTAEDDAPEGTAEAATESTGRPELRTPAPVPAFTPEESAAVRAKLARFTNIYESRDGKLAVYEDADGHIIAVDPSRFV